MKTRLVVLAALVLGTLAGAGGCADNRASIQVQSICYPTEDCPTDGGCDTFLSGTPALKKGADGATGNPTLVVLLQVENQLPDNGDGVIRVNTNDAHVDEAYIEFDPMYPTRTPGTSAWIPAGGTSVVIVPIEVPAAAPAGEIVAKVRLRGYLDDSSRFETGEFPITIAYCSACEVTTCAAGQTSCPPGASGQSPLVCIGEATPP